MLQEKPGNTITPSLYTSASCMDFRQRRDDDDGRQWRANQQSLQPPSHLQQRGGQLPHSSPLPQTQWTDVPLVYRPRHWVDPEEVSPIATRQQLRPDPMSARRSRLPPPPQDTNSSSNRNSKRPGQRRLPRIFRKQDTVDAPQQPQSLDVAMLYPAMSPYDSDRMSTYSAPEQLERFTNGSVGQPNSPGLAPSWSALPSRGDEPSPVGIPRSPTYPPGGRGRMHSAAGVGDAAFDDEQDFRLFVEATAGLPPDIGFSRSAPLDTTMQSPRRRATTAGEMSPQAETPTTMSALQQLAAIPQANQTYRPQSQRAPATQTHQTYRHEWQQAHANRSLRADDVQSSHHPWRTPAMPDDPAPGPDSRERLAASASGLDLWLRSPVSPQAPTHTIPRRAVGSSTARAASVSSHYVVSPLTPGATGAAPPPFMGLDSEVQRQLEELDLEEMGAEEGDFDNDLPDYAQSQAEAQAERRAEAARRAQELQERWLRRGR